MLRYFIRIPDIAAAESDETAARLIAHGYARCGPSAFRAAWQARDALALEEMGQYARAALVLRARAMGARHGV